MTFVNEIMPEEEKEKLTIPVTINSLGAKPTLSRWTIDRTRNAYMLVNRIENSAYTGCEEIWDCTLIWNDNVITFSQRSPKVFRDERGVVLKFGISNVQIPDKIISAQKEILGMIKEALSVKGHYYDGQDFSAIDIDEQI